MHGFKADSHAKARNNPNVEANEISLAAKLASDTCGRVTCVIENRPVFDPPFDA
jgi:hypothetical protein